MIYPLRAPGKWLALYGCRGAKAARMPLSPRRFPRDGFNCSIIFRGGEGNVHGKCRTNRRGRAFRKCAINSEAQRGSPSIVYRIATELLYNPSVICDCSLPTLPIMSPSGRMLVSNFTRLGVRTKGWMTNNAWSPRSSVAMTKDTFGYSSSAELIRQWLSCKTGLQLI